MYLEQLHYLATLSKYPSINQASEALFISQPSLSRAIAKLEKELDLQLVQRTNKMCYLTEDGQQILKRATKIMEEVADIYNYAAKQNANNDIHFLSIPGICDSLIVETINIFQQNSPERKVYLRYEISEAILETLKYSSDDFGLISVVNESGGNDNFDAGDSFDTHFLFRNELSYWMKADHPLADIPPNYEDYEPYLYLSAASRNQLKDDTANTIIFATINLQKTFILQNNAIFLLPHHLTYNDPDILSGRIITKPSKIPVTMDYYLVCRKNNKNTQLVKEFSNIFLSLFHEYTNK